MKKAPLYAFLTFGLFLLSCSNEDSETFDKQYIDLKTVVDSAIKTNNSTQPAYLKEVWINEKHEEVTNQNLDWSKELEVFYLVDLNKRDYLNKYSKDSSENVLSFSLMPGQEASVKKLKVKFDSLTKSITDINAFLSTDNFLYESQRELHLRFKEEQLVTYKVQGWQELFVGSKKTYKMISTKKGS